MGKNNDFATTEQPAVTLQDFIIPAKITAFCEQYEPIEVWSEDCDVFGDTQLRSYFKAVPCQLGDPLAIYTQELEKRGFHMHNDVCGEPVFYARIKNL